MKIPSYITQMFLLLLSLQLCAGPLFVNKTGITINYYPIGNKMKQWQPNAEFEMPQEMKQTIFSLEDIRNELFLDNNFISNNRNNVIHITFDGSKLGYEMVGPIKKTDAEKLKDALDRATKCEDALAKKDQRIKELEEKLKQSSQTTSASTTTSTTTGR